MMLSQFHPHHVLTTNLPDIESECYPSTYFSVLSFGLLQDVSQSKFCMNSWPSSLCSHIARPEHTKYSHANNLEELVNENLQGNPKYSDIACPIATLSPQILH
jgi:hypothetical protein